MTRSPQQQDRPVGGIALVTVAAGGIGSNAHRDVYDQGHVPVDI
ncbi:MAG: hypothetical protein ACOYN7_10445 [Candidatus Nanopelagicales bacterium]